eukprot:m.749828 g.749828  ORF g.749828 m.749828 type:complete len:110 (+) comp23153_c0_seq6:114-443(+)
MCISNGAIVMRCGCVSGVCVCVCAFGACVLCTDMLHACTDAVSDRPHMLPNHFCDVQDHVYAVDVLLRRPCVHSYYDGNSPQWSSLGLQLQSLGCYWGVVPARASPAHD